MAQKFDCPYCGGGTQLLERKHWVLQLRKCERCHLQFRYPKDDSAENDKFYQDNYRESTVTDLPAEAEIPAQISNGFRGVGRNLEDHLKIIKAISPTGRLLDYGCSWGYCVHQFRESGYDASGFEISRPRIEYGKRTLGVDLTDNIFHFPDASFDVIYSAHCMEHIPNPDIALSQFKRLLRPEGSLFIYVPNCGGKEARSLGVHWGPMIGEKHVLALTADFFNFNLPKYGFNAKFASSPYAIPAQNYESAALDGEELLVLGTRI